MWKFIKNLKDEAGASLSENFFDVEDRNLCKDSDLLRKNESRFLPFTEEALVD